MNILKIFLLAMVPFLFAACGQDTPAGEETPEVSTPGASDNPITVTGADADMPIQGTPSPDGGAAGVGSKQHYYCPNSCAGSGGSAGGKCATCGAEYVHNDAYHLQGQAAPPAPAAASGDPMQQLPKTAEPAQNAKGVWHYSCPKGCKGGAGGAGACATCGTALAHNGTYHN